MMIRKDEDYDDKKYDANEDENHYDEYDDNMILTMMSVQALAIIMVEKFFSKVPRVARKMEIMMII
jgi:hypothetical protein